MGKNKNWSYGHSSTQSKIFDFCNTVLMILICIITLYPLWYVAMCSVSNPMLLTQHRGVLLAPLGLTLKGYETVLSYKAIWKAYAVTFFEVLVGTTLNMVFTILFAFVLSRKNMMWHKLITVTAVFTMYFSGGMIPTFLVVKAVGLYDSIWALIIPNLISTYNVIILRTAFYGVPDELEESASLDGAGKLRILFQILVPVIQPSIAAVSLFYAVGHWNEWTSALLYIRNPDLRPLQIVLRSILIQGENIEVTGGQDLQTELNNMLLKYCVIIVSTVPILVFYPFIQKYFTKGVMVGAVKG